MALRRAKAERPATHSAISAADRDFAHVTTEEELELIAARSEYRCHDTHCRRLIATGSDDSLKEASERLDELLEAAGAIHNTFHLIDILVLKALAFYKLSRKD